MRIHDIGPHAEYDYPPASQRGERWDARSRWGSRPHREFGRPFWRAAGLVVVALVVAFGLASLTSCAVAKAVSVDVGRIDQVRLGFGLNAEGRVTAGCTASKFALGDPIHLSMQVNDAGVGSVVHAAVRDVVTDRIAWSEERAVPPGRSQITFAIGRKLGQGRYRAESTLGGEGANPWSFEVHGRRPVVR